MLPIIEKLMEIGVSEIYAIEIAQYILIRKIRDYTELKVEKSKVQDKPILEILANMLKVNKKIKSLYFSGIPIGPEYMITEVIRDCLLVNKTITNLNISHCSLGAELKNFEILKDLLSKTKSLKSLSLLNNRIGSNPKNLKLLVQGLKANKTWKR